MRSFERRLVRLDEAIALVRAGRVEELERRQTRIASTPDFFETRTADEDAGGGGEREGHETFEGGPPSAASSALTLAELREERAEVEALLARARHLAEAGEDSKFEKLRAVMADPAFAQEKLIVFTEHRDTAEFPGAPPGGARDSRGRSPSSTAGSTIASGKRRSSCSGVRRTGVGPAT